MKIQPMQSIKQINRNRVFRLISSSEKISKQDISSLLNVSLPTTTQNLQSLQEEGLVEITGSLPSKIGRKAYAYSVVSDAKIAIGLDITPHHISMVLVDLNGNMISHVREKFAISDSRECYDILTDKVKCFVQKHEISSEKIVGMGISIPGIISFDRKTIVAASTLPVPANFCEIIQAYFDFPCSLFNDANSAGFAEFSRRNRQNETLVYLMLSNTVGGAILFDGRPFYGIDNRSAEFGHITIVPNGRKCSCGKEGCAEAYCSALCLSKYTDNDLFAFFDEVEKGNALFIKELDSYIQNLSILLNDLNMCFNCTVILGGYVGPFIKPFLPKIREYVSERSTHYTDGSFIVPCVCDIEAAALGNALFYIDEFIKTI